MNAVAVQPVTRTPLWEHQIDALDRYETHVRPLPGNPGYLLDHEQGAGKSLAVIAALEKYNRQRVLILCPSKVVAVWPDQFRQHAVRPWHAWAGAVHGARGPLRNPSVAKRCEALIQQNTAAIRLHRPFVAVVNYEASWQGQMAALLLGTEWDAIVMDESHRIKSPSGKASKLAARLTERCRARDGLVLAGTGTAMAHSPLDIWAQFRALDGGWRLGTNYHHFLRRFADAEEIYAAGGVKRTIYKGIRPDMQDEFARLVAQLSHHADAPPQEVLPPNHLTFELGPKARRVYDDLEADLISVLDDGVVTAANAMVLVMRLAQVACGFIKDADTGQIHLLDDPPGKGKLLGDALIDLPKREPVVVFCRFRHDLDVIEHIARSQDRRYGELSGRRIDGMDGPRMHQNVDVLGAQIKSGGTGIDLTRSHHGIFYSVDHSLADYLQARKRQPRHGQTHPVQFTHLLANCAVEYALYGGLQKRGDVVADTLKLIKEHQ